MQRDSKNTSVARWPTHQNRRMASSLPVSSGVSSRAATAGFSALILSVGQARSSTVGFGIQQGGVSGCQHAPNVGWEDRGQ